MMKMKFLAAAAFALAMAAGGAMAQTADYPSRPITLIVSFAPGGSTDLVARILGKKMGEYFKGTPVIVDNRPGGAGVVGAEAVMKSAPDGYTLMFGTSSLTNNPILLPYTEKLVPITMVSGGTYVLVATPGLKAGSVQDVLAMARKDPDALNYASPGVGSTSHLVGELFKMRTSVNITHIAYKGSAPALQDLIGGNVQLMFDAIPSSQAFIKEGKLKPLAVTSAERSKALPDVPTIREAGIANFEAGYWSGLLAPPGTPKPIIDKLSAAVIDILKQSDVKAELERQGAPAVGDTPSEFAGKISAEIKSWTEVIKASNIKLD